MSLMDDLIVKKHRAETELALLKRIRGFYVTQLTPGNTISPAELALIQYCDTLRQECEENLARWQKALDDQTSEDTLRRLIREEVRAALKGDKK